MLPHTPTERYRSRLLQKEIEGSGPAPNDTHDVRIARRLLRRAQLRQPSAAVPERQLDRAVAPFRLFHLLAVTVDDPPPPTGTARDRKCNHIAGKRQGRVRRRISRVLGAQRHARSSV